MFQFCSVQPPEIRDGRYFGVSHHDRKSVRAAAIPKQSRKINTLP